MLSRGLAGDCTVLLTEVGEDGLEVEAVVDLQRLFVLFALLLHHGFVRLAGDEQVMSR